jgi:hypothetical protein
VAGTPDKPIQSLNWCATERRMILKIAMPLYEVRFNDKMEWEEISEIELMDGLYRIYKKVTPAIKEMILGKEIKTPFAVYRLKAQKKVKITR